MTAYDPTPEEIAEARQRLSCHHDDFIRGYTLGTLMDLLDTIGVGGDPETVIRAARAAAEAYKERRVGGAA